MPATGLHEDVFVTPRPVHGAGCPCWLVQQCVRVAPTAVVATLLTALLATTFFTRCRFQLFPFDYFMFCESLKTP